MKLKPFFYYYGGKYRIANKYPRASCMDIIEPFAGAAGYSLRHPHRRIHLYEINPIVASVWQYLVGVSSEEIMCLPSVVQSVDDLSICQEAKWLIGYWLNHGVSEPCRVPSKWMRAGDRPNSFWGYSIKCRIASQLEYIRHWKVYNQCYSTIENFRATWFVDPPYQVMGTYKFRAIDYSSLGRWCLGRSGQVIVCEQDGADWLPFVPLTKSRSLKGGRGAGVSNESVYLQG